ncbi:[FeFe] hydrogenase H-cluster maturation GTPase HydF [Anaerococcus tetradius]|uniref:[FeFe] hydrogenase H-cluster maturation GTPase HydF n=1 Tax=Anaerococcus tetradius TaxID=33036 RepID=UPI0023F222C8|nr:[FeFe] hydrogenase H-cluster maturation GTPase HydF [Anaerococcus tetradius]
MKVQNSERLHIGIFGQTNSGKSSLLNYMTGTDTAIVSNIAGTTTDPIRKAMEITDFGPVLFIDTAGVNDKTSLGQARIAKSRQVIDKCDVFIYCLSLDDDMKILTELKKKEKPIIYVASKQDLPVGSEISEQYKDLAPLKIDIRNKDDRLKIFARIKSLEKKDEPTITKNLVKKGDLVVLVIPQDKAAPKGRLIKPQVMTIRELIDKKATAICCDLTSLENTLSSLNKKPDLVICDSQVFKETSEIIEEGTSLTSFSILFSAFKGDLPYFIKSVKRLDMPLRRVLIAEACTHPPIDEDIGTVKIPRMLKKKYPDLEIEFARGDSLIDYDRYDLIISCGACMFNRTTMLSKVEKAKEKSIAMTNYGITIAYLKGILDKVVLPD